MTDKTHNQTRDNLPAGWRRVAVKDMADSIQYGHTASAVQRSDGPRFLRITDIQDGRVDWDAVPSCDIPKEEVAKYKLAPGDLVFARTGATTGKSFLIGDCPEAVFASYLIRVRVSADVDSRYLATFFQSPDYWQQIEGGKRGIGQPNVNGQVLGQVQFPLAPPDEQRRIVAEIEKQFTRLEAGVAALRRVQTNLKRYRAAVLKAACEGKLVPTEAELSRSKNRKFESAEELLKRVAKSKADFQNKHEIRPEKLKLLFQESPTETLPEGWRWVRFADVVNFITDFQANGSFAGLRENVRQYREPNHAVMVRLVDLRKAMRDKEDFLYTDKSGYEYLAKSSLKGGEILVANVGAGVGTNVMMPEIDYPATLAPNMFLVRVSAEINQQYFFYYSHSPIYWEWLAEVAGGTGQPKMNKTEYRNIWFPLPPLAEQTRIVAEVDRRLSVVEELESVVSANLQRATRLRQSILQKAFTGKLTS